MKEFKEYHKGTDVLKFVRVEFSNDSWYERTFDNNGNELTHKDSNGYYRIKDKFATKEDFKAFTNPKPYAGKKVVIDGVEYELK